MEVAELRPRLITFRVEAFQSDNRVEDSGSPWSLELQQEIQVGLAVPTDASGPLQAVVKLTFFAQAHNELATSQTASFKGEYVAKFHYPPGIIESMVTPLLDQEPHQYLLVAQAFPLAMTHFRRELQSTGFDARQLPLGV